MSTVKRIKIEDVVDFHLVFCNEDKSLKKPHLKIFPIINIRNGDSYQKHVIDNEIFMYEMGDVKSPLTFTNHHTLKDNNKDYGKRSISVNLDKYDEPMRFFSLLESRIRSWFKKNFYLMVNENTNIPSYVNFRSKKLISIIKKHNIDLDEPFNYDEEKNKLLLEKGSLNTSDPEYDKKIEDVETKLKNLDEEKKKRETLSKELLNDCVDFIFENCFVNIVNPPKTFKTPEGKDVTSSNKVYISYSCDPIGDGKKKIESYLNSEKAKSATEEDKNRVVQYMKELNKITCIHNRYSHDQETNEIKEIEHYNEKGLGNYFNGYITFQIEPLRLAGKEKIKFQLKIDAKFIYKVIQQQQETFYFDPFQSSYISTEIESNNKKRKNENTIPLSIDNSKKQKTVDENHPINELENNNEQNQIKDEKSNSSVNSASISENSNDMDQYHTNIIEENFYNEETQPLY